MGWGGTFSLVRFNYNICRIAAISRDFRRNEARFLCLVDCVADRAGFEPSVRGGIPPGDFERDFHAGGFCIRFYFALLTGEGIASKIDAFQGEKVSPQLLAMTILVWLFGQCRQRFRMLEA
jgi:hypothetical protein